MEYPSWPYVSIYLKLGVSTCLVTVLVGVEYCGVATILPMVVTLRINNDFPRPIEFLKS